MKKVIHKEISCCSECPYNYFSEYDDIGTSYGFDWYCRLLGLGSSANLKQIKTKIRKNCPLNDKTTESNKT